MKIKNILVPVDYAPGTEQVVDFALDLAGRCGAGVHLLHVIAAAVSEPLQALYQRIMEETGAGEALRTEIREQIEQKAQAWQAEGVAMQHPQVEGSDVAFETLNYADEHDIDLIILGTHGHRSLRHPALGGLTGEIVRRSERPVLTIPLHEDARPAPPVQRLLVPIDFSRHAASALRHARALAELYGAALSLLFVAEERTVPIFSDTGIPTVSVVKPDAEIVAQAEQALRQLYTEMDGPEGSVDYAIRAGHPAREILAYAEKTAADLIVVSTHGLTAHRFFSFGSVAEKVVQAAKAPVLTLRAFGLNLI